MKPIEPTHHHIYNETIFYSYRIHTNASNWLSDLSTTDLYHLCEKTKDRLIDLLSANGIPTHEIIRPEIYKHDLSFKFLPNFKHPSIHLTFKPFEHLRILKKAYNISVVSWEFDSINIKSHNNIPFTNHYRMLSLFDELWVLSIHQKEILNQYNFFNTYLISEDTPDQEILLTKIIGRILSIKEKANE